MTTKEIKDFESLLKSKGYAYYNQCLSSNENYVYGKSFDITYDEDGDRNIGYQVLFRFWDWRKFGKKGLYEFSLDVAVLVSQEHRTDLVLGQEEYDIEKIEQIAEGFYEFCKKYIPGCAKAK
nr:MAG TPA: hypothetical protein [Caudoviricetes sp.]